jgi:hypothetical protein
MGYCWTRSAWAESVTTQGNTVVATPLCKHEVNALWVAHTQTCLWSLRRPKDKGARNVLIFREPVSIGRRRWLKNSLVRAGSRQWASLGVFTLRHTTQTPKCMPEATTQHVALVDDRHFQRLHGGNRKAKEANPQIECHQIVRHGQPLR